MAVLYRKPEVVKLLLEAGAKATEVDPKGNTLIDLAEKRGYNEIAGILRSAVAKLSMRQKLKFHGLRVGRRYPGHPR